MMTLYDKPADVVRKAIIGRGISPEALASEAEMNPRDLTGFLSGRFSAPAATALARALGLDARALGGLPDYQPEIELPHGVFRLSLPFEDDEVNVWLIESGDTRLIVDCGFRSEDLLRSLEPRSELANHLLVTHAHRDHIGGLEPAMPKLRSAYSRSGLPGTKTICSGSTLEIDPFQIHAVDLAGHHPQALGYFIDGPDLQVMVVGDAIFAGSMGGCADPAAFEQARATIMSALSKAEEALILLPGHGPATRVGCELSANPFLAAWMAR